MRWFGALFHISVAQDIAVELTAAQAALGRDAEAARADNVAAVGLLERAVRERNASLIAPAMVRVRRSAARMQKLADALAGVSCVALFAAGICAAGWAAMTGDNELRLVRRTTRRRDDIVEVSA
jgi:hypothetical protein